MLTQASTWASEYGPLLVPLIGAWFEQHKVRKLLEQLNRQIIGLELKSDHQSERLDQLEVRVSVIEKGMSQQ